MNVEKKVKKQQIELVLSGELTLPHAARLKEELLAALTETGHLVVRFRDVTKADVSSLQIFYAAQRSAAALNKAVDLDQDPIPALQEALYAAGLACRDSRGGGQMKNSFQPGGGQ